MADHYRTSDGWSDEVVRLTCTPDQRDGEWLRIRYLGYHVQPLGIASAGRDTRSLPGNQGTQ